MNDKPIAYIDENDVLTIRASAIGKCSRALWAALNDVQPMAPTERLEAIFDEGHLHEKAVREVLESEGAEMSPQEEVELWIIPGALRVVGHVDGNVVNWKQVWEGKALGKEGFRKFKNVGFDAYPDYAWQISTYMIALDLPALYTVKNRDDGEILRLVIDTPPITLEEITNKCLALYTAYKDHEMPACDPERWMCSFFFLHDEQADDEPLTFVDDPYIEAAAGALVEIREHLKMLNEKEKELKEDLRYLKPGIHATDSFEIEINEVTTHRLDQGLLVEAGINPNEYKKESTYTTIKIKERRKK